MGGAFAGALVLLIVLIVLISCRKKHRTHARNIRMRDLYHDDDGDREIVDFQGGAIGGNIPQQTNTPM